MDNEIAKPGTIKLSFEDALIDKVKTYIGDLLTDADIETITKHAIETAFFKNRYVKNIHGSLEVKEPITYSLVKELLQTKVANYITKYFEENNDAINKIILERLDKEVSLTILNTITQRIDKGFERLANRLDIRF